MLIYIISLNILLVFLAMFNYFIWCRLIETQAELVKAGGEINKLIKQIEKYRHLFKQELN